MEEICVIGGIGVLVLMGLLLLGWAVKRSMAVRRHKKWAGEVRCPRCKTKDCISITPEWYNCPKCKFDFRRKETEK